MGGETTPEVALAMADPKLAGLIGRFGRLSVEQRRRGRPEDPYGALLRAIVGQQLSVKAAATIFGRVVALFDGRSPAPEELLAIDPAELRAAGLSGRKVEYLRDLALHVERGELDFEPR
ncbi:MAG: hypothetical protein H0W09_03980 [Solirubrobacterales bacterium]|nr:hypothetical protein [Solirubrobacterales bacterium]